MKLVSYRGPSDAGLRGGILLDDQILDLTRGFARHEAAEGRPATAVDIVKKYGHGVLGFVEHEAVARPAAEALVTAHAAGAIPREYLVRTADVTLGAPIPRPPSMRDGYAFRQHVETARKNRGLEMIPEFDQFPVFYFTNHQAVIGPGDLHVQKPPPRRARLRARGRDRRREARRAMSPRGDRRREHLRLHDHERLLRPRAADGGDEAVARAGEGEGLRDRARALARDARRAGGARRRDAEGGAPRPRACAPS